MTVGNIHSLWPRLFLIRIHILSRFRLITFETVNSVINAKTFYRSCSKINLFFKLLKLN